MKTNRFIQIIAAMLFTGFAITNMQADWRMTFVSNLQKPLARYLLVGVGTTFGALVARQSMLTTASDSTTTQVPTKHVAVSSPAWGKFILASLAIAGLGYLAYQGFSFVKQKLYTNKVDDLVDQNLRPASEPVDQSPSPASESVAQSSHPIDPLLLSIKHGTAEKIRSELADVPLSSLLQRMVLFIPTMDREIREKMSDTECAFYDEKLREYTKEFMLEEMQKHLNAGNNIDMHEQDDYTALYWAAYWGKDAFVEWLLSNSANTSFCDTQGRTPLHWAVRNGHTETVKLLIAANANKDVKDRQGDTPVALATKYVASLETKRQQGKLGESDVALMVCIRSAINVCN